MLFSKTTNNKDDFVVETFLYFLICLICYAVDSHRHVLSHKSQLQ